MSDHIKIYLNDLNKIITFNNKKKYIWHKLFGYDSNTLVDLMIHIQNLYEEKGFTVEIYSVKSYNYGTGLYIDLYIKISGWRQQPTDQTNK